MASVHVHESAGQSASMCRASGRVCSHVLLYAGELVQWYVCEQQTTDWK